MGSGKSLLDVRILADSSASMKSAAGLRQNKFLCISFNCSSDFHGHFEDGGQC